MRTALTCLRLARSNLSYIQGIATGRTFKTPFDMPDSPATGVRQASQDVKSIKPHIEDVQDCQAAMFEWAESFDTKDWMRLSGCIAPTLYLDYRAVMGKMWESMPADEFVGMASNEHFLGNQRIKTQHFIGAGRWEQRNASEILSYNQMRVAHQRYKDDELKEVLYQGHAHGKATVRFRNVDGTWKFAGLTPDIRWAEHDYDKIFQH